MFVFGAKPYKYNSNACTIIKGTLDSEIGMVFLVRSYIQDPRANGFCPISETIIL